MKKNKFTEFIKGKGYYVLLFVGVIAIAAVAIIGSRLASDRENQEDEFIDLNEMPDNDLEVEQGDDDQLAEDDNHTSDDLVNDDNSNTNDEANNEQDVTDNDDLLEFDVFTEDEEDGIDLSENQDEDITDAVEVADESDDAIEASGTTVKADTTPQLSFNKDEGLLWPVNGNVIMNYSMDHVIYHATLMQFKCNPAIIIDAEVDTEVRAAAKGIVSSVDTNEETGLTVTMDIGDEYSLVYGQLKDVTLKEGSKVNEGDIIGSIEKPTKYFSVEGSNLYFKVLKDDETVNPMIYLR